MNKLSTNLPEISIIVLMNEYSEFTKLFNHNYEECYFELNQCKD